VGIPDYGTHEGETEFFEFLTHDSGKGGFRGKLLQTFPAIDLRGSVYKLPHPGGERTVPLLDLQKGPGIGYGSRNFTAISNDAGIFQKFRLILFREGCHLERVEVTEGFTVGLPLPKNGDPAQPRLGPFEKKKFEKLGIFPHGNPPLLIVIGHVKRIFSGPAAAAEIFFFQIFHEESAPFLESEGFQVPRGSFARIAKGKEDQKINSPRIHAILSKRWTK